MANRYQNNASCSDDSQYLSSNNNTEGILVMTVGEFPKDKKRIIQMKYINEQKHK